MPNALSFNASAQQNQGSTPVEHCPLIAHYRQDHHEVEHALELQAGVQHTQHILHIGYCRPCTYTAVKWLSRSMSSNLAICQQPFALLSQF